MRGPDVAEVRAALQASTVLDFYAWTSRRAGGELESCACPQRSDHSRRAFVINAQSGRWQCFPCGTSGDLLAFIALVERLDIGTEFPAVVAKAAEIAGVGPSELSESERKRQRAEWRARKEAAEKHERETRAARDAAAVPTATAHWGELLTKHQRGFEYLCERRLGDALLTGAVRFDPKHAGSPSVALYSSAGAIRNVVTRRVPELGDPKTPGLYQCPSAGTMVNAVPEIAAGRDVIVTEGVMDSITARLAWRDGIVLGAHGAGNMYKVAQVAAPACIKAKARMLVVPHRDKRGFESATEVCRIAVEAGLSITLGTLGIVKHGHQDLNDAWQAGWRAA